MNTLNGKENIMSPNSYSRSMLVSNTPNAVYKALTSQYGKWWTTDVGVVSAVGDTIKFTFNTSYWLMRANVLSPTYIELECIEAKHILEGMPISILKEWEGTKLKWDIKEQGRNTKITLTHEGLVPSLGCYEICEGGWNHYFLTSLKQYLNGGKGSPFRGEE